MSLTKLSLGGKKDIIYELFPSREALVYASDISAGDGNIENLFLLCTSYAAYALNKLNAALTWSKISQQDVNILYYQPVQILSNVFLVIF